MKITIKNTEATPVEVLKFGVILKPGESATFDIPDTDDKPDPVTVDTTSVEGPKSTKSPKGDK